MVFQHLLDQFEVLFQFPPFALLFPSRQELLLIAPHPIVVSKWASFWNIDLLVALSQHFLLLVFPNWHEIVLLLHVYLAKGLAVVRLDELAVLHSIVGVVHGELRLRGLLPGVLRIMEYHHFLIHY